MPDQRHALPLLGALAVAAAGCQGGAGKAAQTHLERGRVHLEQQTYPKAIAAFTQAIEHDPELVRAYNERGVARAQLERYRPALDDYNRAIARTQLENYESAVADFTRAIERQPEFAPAYANRGGAYLQLGQPKAALRDFQQAAQLFEQQDNPRGYQRMRNAIRSVAP